MNIYKKRTAVRFFIQWKGKYQEDSWGLKFRLWRDWMCELFIEECLPDDYVNIADSRLTPCLLYL